MSRTHLHKLHRKWIKSDDPDKFRNIPLKLRLWYNRINGDKGEFKDLRNKLKEKIINRELKNITHE